MNERLAFLYDVAPAAPLPSFEEFSPYNSPLLLSDPTELARNVRIPQKVRHVLLMQQAGIATDRSGMHMDANTFWENKDKLIAESREQGWLGLGVSTALRSATRTTFKVPSLRITREDDQQTIEEKLDTYAQQLSNVPGRSEEDRLILYHNRWDDKVNCFGANIYFLSNPNQSDSPADRAYLMEIQRGVWPRAIGDDNTDVVRVEKVKHKHSPDTLVQTDNSWDMELARRLFLEYVRSSKTQASIGELMDVTGATGLAMNFEYYRGRINPLDFNT